MHGGDSLKVRDRTMDKSAVKKVLAGLSVAGLVTSVTLTGCQKANGSCGAGGCSKTEKVEGGEAGSGTGSCSGMEDKSGKGTGSCSGMEDKSGKGASSCSGMKDNTDAGEGSKE